MQAALEHMLPYSSFEQILSIQWQAALQYISGHVPSSDLTESSFGTIRPCTPWKMNVLDSEGQYSQGSVLLH